MEFNSNLTNTDTYLPISLTNLDEGVKKILAHNYQNSICAEASGYMIGFERLDCSN